MPIDLSSYVLPNKEDIALLPVFQNLTSAQIHVISTLKQCQSIEHELKTAAVLGFDSESKPTFVKGEVQTGPHLIQLATLDQAYLFQMNAETWTFLATLLANPQQLKVGFGLKNDAHLFRKKGVTLNGTLDLSKCFASFGFKHAIGVKNAVALVMQQNFPKSKKISTSNWAKKQLSPAQIDYAAADAYACILIYHSLLKLQII